MDKYLEYDIHSGREIKRGQELETSYVNGSQPRKRGELKEGGGEAGVIVSPPHHKTVLARSFIFGIWESSWYESTWGLAIPADQV